jgi:hypothetical protein
VKGLGIAVNRPPDEFSRALVVLDRDYTRYIKAAEAFRKKISWQSIANQHAQVYSRIAKEKKSIVAV